MNCEKCRELLWGYLKNETTPEESEEISAHLSLCDECKRELEETKAIIDMIGNIPDEPLPDGYHNELMEKLDNITPSNAVKKVFNWKQLSLVAAAFLLVAAIGSQTDIFSNRPSSQGPELASVSEAAEDDAAVENNETAMYYAPTENNAVSDTSSAGGDTSLSKSVDFGAERNSIAPADNVDTSDDIKNSAANVQDSDMAAVEENTEDIPSAQPRTATSLTDEGEDMVFPETLTAVAEITADREIIITAAEYEGVLEEISAITLSLGGFETERGEDYTIVSMPKENESDLISSLEKIGELATTADNTTANDNKIFKITLAK